MRKFVRLSLLAAGFLAAAGMTAGIATASTGHQPAARPAAVAPAGAPVCTAGDCVVYDLSTQSGCTESTVGATFDSRWTTGLSSRSDETILGAHIVAYRILFSNGWSGWYVPGVNDIDYKFNVGPNTERHIWSYFYDHTHDYIICT
jgi:hypothetical protein